MQSVLSDIGPKHVKAVAEGKLHAQLLQFSSRLIEGLSQPSTSSLSFQVACVCHRKYWTCGSTGSTCGFFEWKPPEDAIMSQQSDMARPAACGSGSGLVIQDEGKAVNGSQSGPLCHCGLPVRKSSIKAGPHAGRCKSFLHLLRWLLEQGAS